MLVKCYFLPKAENDLIRHEKILLCSQTVYSFGEHCLILLLTSQSGKTVVRKTTSQQQEYLRLQHPIKLDLVSILLQY